MHCLSSCLLHMKIKVCHFLTLVCSLIELHQYPKRCSSQLMRQFFANLFLMGAWLGLQISNSIFK